MPAAGILNPHHIEFERFLHASVDEDRNGNVVTVLSTFARLNIDPWEEAAELAALEREAAGSRLEVLLSCFRDVPALRQDHGSVARELTRLLPERPARVANISGATTMGPAMSAGTICAVLAVLFLLMQMMVAGAPGFGE